MVRWEDFFLKQVIIEKTIELDHIYQRIDHLSCKKQANTTALSEGLQCTGTIDITGTGYLDQHEVPIHESIDLSIFAPFSKLSDTEQFDVQMRNYDLKLDQNLLHCTFVFDVYGVEEKKQDNDEASLDDLLDDRHVVNEKVRYALAYSNDTYYTLASRFGVDERVLRELNHNKIINGRMLILLPCG